MKILSQQIKNKISKNCATAVEESRNRILLISLGYGFDENNYIGGTEQSAQRLVQALEKGGFIIDVLANRSKDISLNIKSDNKKLFGLSWLYEGLNKTLKYYTNKKPELVYARYAGLPLILGVIFKILWKVPLVVSVHGGDMRKNGLINSFIMLLLRNANIVVSYDNKDHIHKLRSYGIPSVTINNIIDRDLFVPMGELPYKRVIYVGGERKIKGVETIRDLIVDFSRIEFRNIEFHLFGVDKEDRFNNIYIHKFWKPSDLAKFYRESDLFILPSKEEGIPGALLEAMSAGLYVISSNIDFSKRMFQEKFCFDYNDLTRIKYLINQYDINIDYFKGQKLRNKLILSNEFNTYYILTHWKSLLDGLIHENKLRKIF